MSSEHKHSSSDSEDASDDFCYYCDDGGELICCDDCPKVFHLKCLGIRTNPKGDWVCPECKKEKSARESGDTITEEISRTVAPIDLSQADTDEIDGFTIMSFPRPSSMT
eukprot:TRINITY_DN8142_c0_g1_i1.p1 TRINITY_DN8142_c0_g1~~TRINITY_DN8142_c0_g1_i1.p1  ORF type:complete len:109 (+),score=5.06 TRINITY_DN8142_c0_g1_i1:70-396(+)